MLRKGNMPSFLVQTIMALKIGIWPRLNHFMCKVQRHATHQLRNQLVSALKYEIALLAREPAVFRFRFWPQM